MTNGNPPRVLLIDDNPAIHEDFRKILGPANNGGAELAQAEAAVFGTVGTNLDLMWFEVDSAFQGQEGVVCAQKARQEERPYAIAFVDMRMPPGWDGIKTISELWKVDPALQVIICTAYSDYSWEDMIGHLGMTDRLLILKKPFDNIEVRQLACSMTTKWNLARQLTAQISNLESLVSERTASLENSLSLTEATLESTADGILVINREGKVTSHNQRFLKMWDIPPDLIDRRDDRELLTHVARQLKKPEEFLQRVKEVYHEDEPESFDVLEFEDGRIFERYSLPQRIHGVNIGRVWNFRDVTKPQSMEHQLRQSQKMQAIGQLAGGVAHDFNNLLTVISGHCELLATQVKESGFPTDNIEEIQKAAQRAAQLTRQLLAFSRKQVLQPKVLDLNEIVAGMENMARRLIGEDVELRTVLKRPLGRITADPGQIEQVILNLVVNARDAMPRGGRLLIETDNVTLGEKTVHKNRELEVGEYVVLAVSDTGIGMAESVKAHLFEPFFTTKGLAKGTGLGLATCYGIVKQSGGDIRVYSEPDHGSTFRIYFPKSNTAIVPRDLPPLDTPCQGTETVLLVEDDISVRHLTTSILKSRGYTVLEASDGLEAMQLILGEHCPHFDLIISDMIMPRMGGKELVESVRLKLPAVKVLFISGYTDDALADRGALGPGTEFLEKPFSHKQLGQRVREVLDKTVLNMSLLDVRR